MQGGHSGDQVRLVRHQVNFVQKRHHRPGSVRQRTDELLIQRSCAVPGVQDKEDDIHAFEPGHRQLHHLPVQAEMGLVKPGMINEDDLAVGGGADAGDAVAGGLGLVGDDANLPSDQRIQKRGLAHIGGAD